MSNILSHGLTVPTNPVQPQPVTASTVPDISSNNDSFSPIPSALDSYFNNKLYEQDADFMQNRAFEDDIPDSAYARRAVRTAGLIAYVTSDLSPARAKQSRDTFGRTVPYRQDKYTGMLVGRALCSNLGYPGDPVTFIRNHGKDTLGLEMPQTGYSTAQELYSLIGTTFATQQRNSYTKAVQAEQARAKAAEETRQRVLPGALTRAVTGNSITPEEDAALKSCGVSETSLAKVRLLTGLKGSAAIENKGIVGDPANSLNGVSLLGIESTPFLKNFSLFDREGLYKAARIIGDDKVAKALYLNLVRIAGRNHRDSHYSRNFLDNLAASTANLGGSITRAFSDQFIDVGFGAGMGAASLFYEDAPITQYKALLAEASDAFAKGYKQRDAELNQNYGSSIGKRILWNLQDFPTTIADPVANTAPFLNPYTAVVAIGAKAAEEQNIAASKAGGDPNAGIMELGISPSVRGAIFGASVYGTGWAAGKALGKLGKTSIGRSVAARCAISPTTRYTANVTEGITTEAVEEAVDAYGQDIMEETLDAVGLMEQREKRANWKQFNKLLQDTDFWGANVGMNLVFGAFGYKGSRSKSPYKDVLKELGFTQKEETRLQLELVKAQMQGAGKGALSDIVLESVRAKQAANPKLFKERATAMVANAKQKQAIQEAAANGVLKHSLKKSGASNMKKNEDGTYNVQRVIRGEDGKFELVEERFTEQQLIDWLASDVNRAVTSEILYIQSLVRGEQVSRAAESAATTPFSRVVSMLNAPAELLAKLDGKTSFDEETLTLFSEYAIQEINLRMSRGQTAEQARSAEFGSTGATLGAIANLSSDFDTRVSHAIATGELQPGQIPQSNAYILPGKTPGDNILMLARGEASAKDVAHDWLEGFARARYFSNRSYWQQALDALDSDLLSSGIISKSLFGEPKSQREDLHYIEVFSHLAEMDFLANHDAVTLSDNSHGILDEVLDDLGAVQGGLELASALSQYLTSDAAKNAVGEALDPLRGILSEAGAALTDLLATAEASSPKSAADFIIHNQQNIEEDVRIRLADLAKTADLPPVTKTDTPKPTDTALPPEATDGLNVTVADLAKLNGLNADGTRPAPIGSTYSRIDPKKNGLSLIGGLAHGMPDGSICGSAKLADITIHPTIGTIDPARLRPNADEKEVILFRKKDGTLQAIGGLAFLHHATTCGVENVPVRVFSSGKKYTPQWAAKTAAESLIRANLATTAQTLSYLTKHALTRDAARRSNLIPKDTNGQELPTSRAAWLLHQHATKKTIADTISGRISTAAALATIEDKAASLLKQAAQFSLPGFETSSFSVTSKQAQSAFNKNGVLEADNAIITKPGASFSIKALHVSPHKFFKFTTSKMGSGEGAQAYGWGLYFATNREVNRFYFDEFSLPHYQLHMGNTPLSDKELEKIVKESLMRHGGQELVDDMAHGLAYSFKLYGANKTLEDYLDFLKAGGETINGLEASLRELAALNIEEGSSPRSPINYRVELNVDDSNLLMWDERYSGQKIKDLLGDDLFERIYDEGDEEASLLDNGEGIYMLMKSVFGGKEAASKKLLESGVKGIKYLDGNSRSAGEGSYNYVIFDGNDIKITAINETGIWSMTEGWQPYTDTTASFSVIGKNAQTWDKYASRAFKGRDDGLERAEIDASKSQFNQSALLSEAENNIETLTDFFSTLTTNQKHLFYELEETVDTLIDLYNTPGSKLEDLYASTARKNKLTAETSALITDFLQTKGITLNGTLNHTDVLYIYNLYYNGQETPRPANLFSKFGNTDTPRNVELYKVLDFPELYEAYPQLKYYTVEIDDNMGKGIAGSFSEKKYKISIPSSLIFAYNVKSVLLHEIQHAIQEIEGFARGGNRDTARENAFLLSALYPETYSFLDELSDYEVYLRLAGEIEARNVEKRRFMDESMRAATPFNSTLEYPGEAIVPSSFSLTAKQAAYTPEMLAIKEATEKDGTFMKAPNGKPTNLNERQWLQVRTSAFKNWFGDWENDPYNASKVVDENGEPKVVYHGARHAGFRVFDNEMGERRSDAPDGTSFFSSSYNVAATYTPEKSEPDLLDEELQQEIEEYGVEGFDGGIYEVFLNIRDPHVVDFKGRGWQDDRAFYTLQDEKGDYVYPVNGDEYYDSEEDARERAEALGLTEYEIYPEHKDTNSVTQEALDMGADGAIIENVIDEGSYGYGSIEATDYVVFDSTQVKSATQNRGTFNRNNPDITFSITAAKPRRKYMPLSEAVKLEQYMAMEAYARKLYRDAISLAQANPKNKLDDAVRAAMHLRALLNAVFATLPKEAQPWKALGYARKQIDTLTWAVSHSYANLDPHQAPGISPAEIDKYNESGYRDRRQWLANKLSRLIVSVADSSARAIEAHACRTLLDTAEATVKTLLPKYQKSGKERRGTTSAEVFTKALEFYNMFDWSVEKRAQELTAVSDTLNSQDLTDAERTAAEKRRQAILAFAGLRRESLPRVKAGVETLLAYIQTGRLAWEQKLLEERRATEAIQEAIAALEPRIEHSTTTAKEDQKRGWFANFFTSLQNPVQTLNQLANLPGRVGAIFADIRTRLAMAEDAKTYAVQQAHQDAAAALDTILGITGEPSISRQIKRATFLSDANERINTGIRKPGRIKITTFEFTQQDIINLQQIRKEQGEEAFRLALDTHRRKYSQEDLLANTIPYEEVFQDALTQMQDPAYRGGTIYVERYGERDIAHEDTLILTRLQAANLWLLAQQPSYANKYDQNGNLIERGMLDILGYTEKVLADLEAFIGPELRAYAIWKREYLNTTGLFEAYEQHMGLPFPKEENYWPGAFDNTSNNAGLDALQTAYAGNGVYNMLIIRKKHLSEPNLSVDLEAAWEHAIQQHYHYIHLSPITRQLRAITRDSDTRQRLRKIVGNATLDNLQTQVNTLDGAPAQQLQAATHANHLLARWLSAWAKALLNMATGTTVKQVSAAAHALAHPGINLLNILPKLISATISDITGKTLTPGHKTPREIRQLKAFRVRFNREDLSTKASRLTPGETQGKLAIVDLFGSRFLEYTDTWANSQAMAAVYNTEYDRAKAIMLTANEGKPLTPEQEQQLEQHCIQTVAVTLKQTAQPLEREDKAAITQQKNWAMNQNFFMMGEIISKLGCTVSLIKAGYAKAYGKPKYEATKIKLKALLKGLTFYSGMGMASQAVLAALSYAIGSAPDSDDEDFLDWVIGNIVAGAIGFSYLNALPFIGEGVAAIAQSATGKHGVFATYATTGVGITYKDIQDLLKILDPDKPIEDRIYAGSNWLRLLTTLTGFFAVSKGATFVTELFSAANNINNAVRPTLQRAKNEAKKEQKEIKALKKQIKKQGTQKRYTQLR